VWHAPREQLHKCSEWEKCPRGRMRSPRGGAPVNHGETMETRRSSPCLLCPVLQHTVWVEVCTNVAVCGPCLHQHKPSFSASRCHRSAGRASAYVSNDAGMQTFPAGVVYSSTARSRVSACYCNAILVATPSQAQQLPPSARSPHPAPPASPPPENGTPPPHPGKMP
jgi:hypothetical protein